MFRFRSFRWNEDLLCCETIQTKTTIKVDYTYSRALPRICSKNHWRQLRFKSLTDSVSPSRSWEWFLKASIQFPKRLSVAASQQRVLSFAISTKPIKCEKWSNATAEMDQICFGVEAPSCTERLDNADRLHRPFAKKCDGHLLVLSMYMIVCDSARELAEGAKTGIHSTSRRRCVSLQVRVLGKKGFHAWSKLCNSAHMCM